LYTTKTPITAAGMLNDKALPFFEEQGMGILRMLTDRGTEYCGSVEKHDYELFLGVCGIEHTKTKARHPQTNGICERFHKTILNEFGVPSALHWTLCRLTLTHGWMDTTRNELIRGKCVADGRLWKL